MLSLHVYGQGEAESPRSKLTGASGLLGPEDPERKKSGGDSRDRIGDPRRLSSHPAAAQTEVPGEREGKERKMLLRR